jgi:hypothetical protein
MADLSKCVVDEPGPPNGRWADRYKDIIAQKMIGQWIDVGLAWGLTSPGSIYQSQAIAHDHGLEIEIRRDQGRNLLRATRMKDMTRGR